MADFMDIIKERRSLRRYEEKDIPDEVLNKVLEAVQWAPSWTNTQVWEVVVVKDPAIKSALSETLTEWNPARKSVAGAPVVLAMCGKLGSSGFYKGQPTTKLGDWYMYDLGLASQNLCLAAHGLGLGTVIVGAYDVAQAEKVLGVPEGYALVSLIPVGYPSKGASAPKRREISEFTHKDKF